MKMYLVVYVAGAGLLCKRSGVRDHFHFVQNVLVEQIDEMQRKVGLFV
jgi:hypothetical protein